MPEHLKQAASLPIDFSWIIQASYYLPLLSDVNSISGELIKEKIFKK